MFKIISETPLESQDEIESLLSVEIDKLESDPALNYQKEKLLGFKNSLTILKRISSDEWEEERDKICKVVAERKLKIKQNSKIFDQEEDIFADEVDEAQKSSGVDEKMEEEEDFGVQWNDEEEKEISQEEQEKEEEKDDKDNSSSESSSTSSSEAESSQSEE
ncbi:hypothetical protein ADUPG1_010968 [Aduncisulcus paluster]|uniref:Uncharacterized protein n=1 Tax=Aduncisulcus paluster TaxID=2918883 RepID=A0ABQ5JY33_9EUKA|nr:hypothetical protein ADUPG1_010968 [Aduncisulcus paluster]|eukprot:gnl/Carplike_NY0171/3355_a4512_603.p4 GENE.gnl/Carplike_NY0171/3355_a4512_603~~gnl/Carplike_NY0171/3355_a4512_603.p4  ORF type:complete len:162 (-),score=58.74 gnl/Carplike_NY0171/3355_a4512_603:568-1053(-)